MITDIENRTADHAAALIVEQQLDELRSQQAKSLFADAHWLEAVARIFEERFPTTAAAAGDRIAKAIQIARYSGNIYAADLPGVYHVRASRGDAWYEVDAVKHSCSCPDHMHRGTANPCKHRLAVGLLTNGANWIVDNERQHIQTNHNPMPYAIRTAKNLMENAQYYEKEAIEEMEKYDYGTPEYQAAARQVRQAARNARHLEDNYRQIYAEYYKDIKP